MPQYSLSYNSEDATFFYERYEAQDTFEIYFSLNPEERAKFKRPSRLKTGYGIVTEKETGRKMYLVVKE